MPKTKSEDTRSTNPAEHGTLKPTDNRYVACEQFPKGGERIQLIHRTDLTEGLDAILSENKTRLPPSTSVPERGIREVAAYHCIVGRTPWRKGNSCLEAATFAGINKAQLTQRNSKLLFGRGNLVYDHPDINI